MSDMQSRPEHVTFEDQSTADLVREALNETKELVRIEIELARTEVEKEVRRAKRAAIGFGVAFTAAVVFLSVLAVSLILALGGGVGVALAIAGVLVVITGIAAAAAYKTLPKRPLERTRDRLRGGVAELKEHLA